MNWKWFHPYACERVHKRSAAYEALKDSCMQQMWEFTLRLYPQLRTAKVSHMEGGSPLSNNYYINSTKGEIYGSDHGFERFRPEALLATRPDHYGIPGVVLAGQDSFTGGFCGGLIGGLLTAGEVLGSKLGVLLGVVSSGIRCIDNFEI